MYYVIQEHNRGKRLIINILQLTIIYTGGGGGGGGGEIKLLYYRGMYIQCHVECNEEIKFNNNL